MKSRSSQLTLIIAGVYIKSEAYPNILHTINLLKKLSEFNIKEINYPIIINSNKKGVTKLIKQPFKFIISHILVIIKLISCKRLCVYIPYPGIFIQSLVSFLPKSLRPEKVVLDAFISLYDTIVNDRKLLTRQNIFAKLIFYIEKRAFKTSDVVIVDTATNAQFFSQLYNLPVEKFKDIPLATNESCFKPQNYNPVNKNHCHILFIGTLIPLHGIDIIIDAIRQLKAKKWISFKIIGNGQESRWIEEYLMEQPENLHWIKEWQSSEVLAKEIASADICLGIFGTTDKTQRVCPYKIYHYAQVGRPIITGDTRWSRHIKPTESDIPFITIPTGNSKYLADSILKLCYSSETRTSLAQNAQLFYQNFLSNARSYTELSRIFYNG